MLFAVKNIALKTPYARAFNYLTDLRKLPEWTNAFATVDTNGEAVMRTPEGEVSVQLEDITDEKAGTIDTRMTFPDGSSGMAYSRLVKLDEEHCAYSFLLTPPPVALEQLEGALAEQAEILEKELIKLKEILER